jgi:Putative adhesin
MSKAWLVGVGIFAVAAASAQADEWSRQYELKGRPELRLTTDDGSVRVEAGDGPRIEAEVTTEGWKIGPGEVTITESQTGDGVAIEVRVPRRQHSGHDWGRRSVKLVVRVPREADLDIRTGDGSVDVEPIAGRITIATGDGSIKAAGLHGQIKLHTGDGSIHATGLEGRLQADTGDGQVNVSGRFEGLDLRTGDGHIDAEVERGSKVSEGWSLSSGDGGISMRIPEDLGAELDAHSGDGSIVLDAPVTVTGTVSANAVRGKLAGGGGSLRVRTGDGSIHLQRL